MARLELKMEPVSVVRRLRYSLTLLITTSCIVFFIQVIPYRISSFRRPSPSPITVFDVPLVGSELEKEIFRSGEGGRGEVVSKTILMWNSFFGEEDYLVFDMSRLGCPATPFPLCQLTYNRTVVDKADSILFHWRGIALNDLPSREDERQIWVLLNYESPAYVDRNVIRRLGPDINWTVSYRLDSDIFSPYGKLQRRKESGHRASKMEEETGGGGGEAFPKKDSVVWLVSNCASSGGREEFVARLNKSIPVEVFGDCGRPANFCAQGPNVECYRKLSAKYKFYLSFENSLCRDYVTEKFYLALDAGLVPVVLGGSDYGPFAPAGSYINALDFDSADSLALHLRRVADNYTLYQEYHRWRRTYEVAFSTLEDLPSRSWLCDLCRRLYQPHKWPGPKDLERWWFEEASCWKVSNWSISREIIQDLGKRLKETFMSPILKMGRDLTSNLYRA